MEHICYLTGMYSRKDPLIFERQGRSMALLDYKVTIVVCDKDSDQIIDNVFLTSCNWMPKSRISRMLFSSKHIMNKAIELDADIYQISEPELLHVGVLLKRKGKKVIFNMRENYIASIKEKEYIPRIFRKIISKYVNNRFERLLPKYDAVISVTDSLETEIKQYNCNKSIVVTNFPIVRDIEDITIEEYKSREDVLCYFGTIYKVSKQENIFRAIENIKDFKYHIAGVFENNYPIHEDAFWENVDFSGRFNKIEMYDFLRQATISNVLRDFSTGGSPNGSLGILKMFESMEAALPIICADVEINREIIKKYECGICVDINNIAQIRGAIKFLIDNKETAYQMGQNGRRAVLEEYNWNSQFEKYRELVYSL